MMSPGLSFLGIGVGLANKCRRAGGKAWKMELSSEVSENGCPGSQECVQALCFWSFVKFLFFFASVFGGLEGRRQGSSTLTAGHLMALRRSVGLGRDNGVHREVDRT